MEFAPDPQVRDLTVADENLGLGTDYRPRHLSPSSASLYQQCPRKWRHRYVDRLPDPPGEPALVGTFAHLILEHLLRLPEGQRSQDAAKELAREYWPEMEQEKDYQALTLSDAQAKAFRWKAWEAVAGLWLLENPDETQVHATEHEVQVDISGVPFRLHYLGQRTLGVRVTSSNLGDAVQELGATWSSLISDCENNQFDTSTGPLCAWCPFLAECPDGQKEVITRNEAGSVRADAPGLAIVYAEQA
jgi:hypothetical protein